MMPDDEHVEFVKRYVMLTELLRNIDDSDEMFYGRFCSIIIKNGMFEKMYSYLDSNTNITKEQVLEHFNDLVIAINRR